METMIQELGPWSWWILGLILLGLEILVPGSVMVWFGIAAFLVGAISFLIDWSWQLQFFTFALLSLVTFFIGRRYFKSKTPPPSDNPNLNQRTKRLIGQTFVLEDAIKNGQGRVRIGDTLWRITGPDMPGGTKIIITGSKGALLQVEVAPEEAVPEEE